MRQPLDRLNVSIIAECARQNLQDDSEPSRQCKVGVGQKMVAVENLMQRAINDSRLEQAETTRLGQDLRYTF